MTIMDPIKRSPKANIIITFNHFFNSLTVTFFITFQSWYFWILKSIQVWLFEFITNIMFKQNFMNGSWNYLNWGFIKQNSQIQIWTLITSLLIQRRYSTNYCWKIEFMLRVRKVLLYLNSMCLIPPSVVQKKLWIYVDFKGLWQRGTSKISAPITHKGKTTSTLKGDPGIKLGTKIQTMALLCVNSIFPSPSTQLTFFVNWMRPFCNAG